MQLLLWLLLAYLLGSVSGSLLLGKLKGTDIRRQGSGNAGGTNALRTQGIRFALAVVFIDIGKGVLALAMLPDTGQALFGQALSVASVQSAAAFACVLGHIYPVFFGFRGGKGAATWVGALLVIAPLAFCGMLSVWLLLLVTTGYVGLATIVAALLAPLFVFAVTLPEQRLDYLIGGIALSALVVFAHRDNVVRLFKGTESRFQKVRLWGANG